MFASPMRSGVFSSDDMHPVIEPSPSAALITLGLQLFAQTPAATPAAQSSATATPAQAAAAARPKPEETEIWEPIPDVVTPGATPGAPPSDAIVLFDGSNEDEWTTIGGKSPAGWVVDNGILTVDKSKGGIETKRKFKNYQLHVEW